MFTCLSTGFVKQKVEVYPEAEALFHDSLHKKKVRVLIATYLKSDRVSLGNCLYILCRLAEPGMFAYNPSLAG